MGSAVPQPTGFDVARAMLHQMEHESSEAIARTGEIDVPALAQILTHHLDDPKHHGDVRLFLAGYLSRCLLGAVPDHTRWEP